jgi:hypothetical protein
VILLVSYDLKVPGRDYTKLYGVLKTASSWCHYLESTWFISTYESVESWSDKIRAAIDENDRLFIVDITGKKYNGWLPQKAWEWLSSHSQ